MHAIYQTALYAKYLGLQSAITLLYQLEKLRGQKYEDDLHHLRVKQRAVWKRMSPARRDAHVSSF